MRAGRPPAAGYPLIRAYECEQYAAIQVYWRLCQHSQSSLSKLLWPEWLSQSWGLSFQSYFHDFDFLLVSLVDQVSLSDCPVEAS